MIYTTFQKPLIFSNAVLYINDVQISISPAINSDNPIIFSLPSHFASGDVAIILHNVAVKKDSNYITAVTANSDSVSAQLLQ